MPSALIGDGVHLFYEDSGAPPGVENAGYTTIVVVHGLSFNGSIFTPMLTHAPEHGIRIIAVNMRDYKGSTPYTDEELYEFVTDNIEVQNKAVGRVGREIAAFLVFICTELGIPPRPADGGDVGGLVLLAWSMYCMGLLSMLGDHQVLDQRMKETLSPFLRKVILYDPPYHVFGTEPETSLTHPLNDPSVPVAEKPAAFLKWVTAYCTPVADESPGAITLETLQSRTEFGTRTSEKMSEDDIQRIVEPGVMLRSGALLVTNPEIHRRNAHTMFFGTESILSHVTVLALWCDCSLWPTLWGAKILDGIRQQSPPPGAYKRELSIVKIKGANHTYHWEEPEKMVQLLVKNI